ncbi:pantoate--beta-alanine ligase [Paracoccaceae bacterium GXU_MW_L88]
MQQVQTPETLKAQVLAWQRDGDVVALVPTMGALHEGHLGLVRLAREVADKVVASVFVNPTQFNDPDDFAAYPQTLEDDAKMLADEGCDLLYVPNGAAMYPHGFATTVHVEGPSEGLCGANRPGHFDGVATVVSKLLLQSGADKALFGEKDFQQLAVIRRLVADLNIPVEIVPGPIARAEDGLALSSRNRRLSDEERAIAPQMNRILRETGEKLTAGADTSILPESMQAIEAAGFRNVEYLELRRASDLVPMSAADAPGRLLVAAWLGDVRLIDNIPVAAKG